MNEVEMYISNKSDIQKEWINIFINYMKSMHGYLMVSIEWGMPTYKMGNNYLAIAANKNYFSIHTLDFEMVQYANELIPELNVGKGCIRIKYNNQNSIPLLFNVIDKIVRRNYHE